MRPGTADAALDDLRHLAQALHSRGPLPRTRCCCWIMLQSLAPDHIETLKHRMKVMGAPGQTLDALACPGRLEGLRGDVEDLLAEIRAQMPATLDRFNRHIAAGEMAQAETLYRGAGRPVARQRARSWTAP